MCILEKEVDQNINADQYDMIQLSDSVRRNIEEEIEEIEEKVIEINENMTEMIDDEKNQFEDCIISDTNETEERKESKES